MLENLLGQRTQRTFFGIAQRNDGTMPSIHTIVADIIKWSHVCHTPAIESFGRSCRIVAPLYPLPSCHWQCCVRANAQTMRTIFMHIQHVSPLRRRMYCIHSVCTLGTRCYYVLWTDARCIYGRTQKCSLDEWLEWWLNRKKIEWEINRRTARTRRSRRRNDDNLPLINRTRYTYAAHVFSLLTQFTQSNRLVVSVCV